MSQTLIQYDETSNLIASLTILKMSLEQIQEHGLSKRPEFLKLLVLGLHGTLESVLMNALTSNGSIGAYHRDSHKSEMNFRKNGGGAPCSYVDVISNFIKRLESANWTSVYVDSQPLVLNQKQKEEVEALQKLRNDLMHFEPKGTIYTAAEIFEMAKTIMSLVFEVIEKTKLVHFDFRSNEIERCLADINMKISNLK
jgi:hypothetical protein